MKHGCWTPQPQRRPQLGATDSVPASLSENDWLPLAKGTLRRRLHLRVIEVRRNGKQCGRRRGGDQEAGGDTEADAAEREEERLRSDSGSCTRVGRRSSKRIRGQDRDTACGVAKAASGASVASALPTRSQERNPRPHR